MHINLKESLKWQQQCRKCNKIHIVDDESIIIEGWRGLITDYNAIFSLRNWERKKITENNERRLCDNQMPQYDKLYYSLFVFFIRRTWDINININFIF